MTPTTATPAPATLRGGEWLLQASNPADVFTPARLSEEHRLIAQTVVDFVNNEVLPVLDRLEQKDWGLARDLVKRCGALGLLGVDVAGGLRRRTARQGVVDDRQRAHVAVGVVRRHVRRTCQPAGAAARRSSAPRTRSGATCRGS